MGDGLDIPPKGHNLTADEIRARWGSAWSVLLQPTGTGRDEAHRGQPREPLRFTPYDGHQYHGWDWYADKLVEAGEHGNASAVARAMDQRLPDWVGGDSPVPHGWGVWPGCDR